MPLELSIIALRFTLVFILSTIFGLERQRMHKTVGFSTFVFVAMGACGLAILTTEIASENPFPLLAAIVTGIGFLGAGALIKTSDKIFGFTTAASLWAFAILGLVIGVGNYPIAGILYISMWLVIFIDWYFESKGIGSYQQKVTIITRKILPEKEVRNLLTKKAEKCKLITVETNNALKKATFVYLVEGTKEYTDKIPHYFGEKPWVESCKVE